MTRYLVLSMYSYAPKGGKKNWYPDGEIATIVDAEDREGAINKALDIVEQDGNYYLDNHEGSEAMMIALPESERELYVVKPSPGYTVSQYVPPPPRTKKVKSDA